MKPLMKAALTLIIVAVVMVLCSDIFIRARGLDGQFGLNARSYDITATIMLMLGLYAFWISARSDRAPDPVITRIITAGTTGPSDTLYDVRDTLEQLVATSMGKVKATIVEDDQRFHAHLVGHESAMNHLLASLMRHLDESRDWMRIEE